VVARAQNEALLPAVTADEVEWALDRILKSKFFAHAPKKQKFLRLVCDFYLKGRSRELNEYLIGREVFERAESYNPSADPIVRVGAYEIRKKLELYYQHEGAGDEIRLEIPVGSYEPVFIRPQPDAPAEELAPSPPVATTVAPGRGRAWRRGLAESLIGAGLILIIAFLALGNYQLRRQIAARGIEAETIGGPVWDPFLSGHDPTLLVLSNPAVFRLSNAGDSEVVIRRSIELSGEQSRRVSEALENNFAFRHLPADPRLVLSVDTYTGLGEAIGAQRVTELLRAAGRSVLLKRSRTLSADDLKRHHVILFGSVWSNEWSGKIDVKEDFVYTGQATIENHRPRPGESPVYRSKFDRRSGALVEDYALVTVKPNISAENLVMTISGLRSAGTEAAAEFITSRHHLADLNHHLNSISPLPRYYQALLRVSVENAVPTTVSLVSLHPLDVIAR
jgi:hypothetical protein